MFKRKKQIEVNNLEEQGKMLTDDVKPKKSRKVKALILCTAVFVLYMLISFFSGKILAGFIALLQVALCIFTLLIKNGKIKTSFRKYYKISPIIALVLIIPFSSAFLSNDNTAKKFEWSDIILNEMLPEPTSKRAEIIENNNDSLYIYIHKTSAEEYYEYISNCEKMGYTIEANKTDSAYNAYGNNGYKLELSFVVDEDKLCIDLKAPMELGALQWPKSGMAKLLPIPNSSMGNIETDDAMSFSAYVGNISISDFNDYVESCVNSGFNVERTKTEKAFNAKNSNDYSLSIEYKGNGLVYIEIKEPEYNIQVKVNSVNNIAFSTYNISVYADNSYLGDLDNGDVGAFDVILNKGPHTIKFVNTENKAISGQVDIIISKNETLEFKLYSYNDKINVDVISGTVDIKINSIDISNTQDLTFYSWSSAKRISFEVTTNEEHSQPQNLIEFVSENPEVATIEFDNSSSYALYATVTPVGAGETTLYIQSKDGTIKSQAIRVIVEKEETTAEETTTESYDSNYDYEEEEKDNSRTVYIAPSGKKYHYSKSCAGKNAMERDLDDVKGAYGPCQKCVG